MTIRLLIDEEFVISGSANLNERSLAGDRDAEIRVALLADDGKLKECNERIAKLQLDASKRHLGGKLPTDSDAPEKPSRAQEMQGTGRANWSAMSATERKPKEPIGHLVNIPFRRNGDDVRDPLGERHSGAASARSVHLRRGGEAIP